jgi:hypothetical protein
MNRKGAIQLWLIGAVITLIVAAIYAPQYLNLGQITGSGDYIERPVFKYVKCEASSGIKYADGIIAKDGGWINKPSVSSSYNVILKAPAGRTFASHNFEYYVCNSRVLDKSNCRKYATKESVSANGEVSIIGLKNEEYVWAQYQKQILGYSAESGATYQIGFVPYGLREYNVLGGGSGGFINPNDCEVSVADDSWKDRFLGTDSDKIQNTVSKVKGEYDRILQPEEVRWYVSGYVTSAAPSFKLTYSNQDAWCRSDGDKATIYAINEINAGSGTYKVASVEFSDILGTENCCPGDKLPGKACNSNFKWVSTQPVDNKGTTNVECSAFNPCSGGTYTPYDKGVIARYDCVNSKCILSTKQVKCANDLDCSDSNQVCDKNKWECVQANVNLKGMVINTIPDNAQTCKEQGGTWMKETSADKTWYNYLGIGEPKVVVQEYCKAKGGLFDSIPWATLLFFGILILAAFLGYRYAWPLLRRFL